MWKLKQATNKEYMGCKDCALRYWCIAGATNYQTKKLTGTHCNGDSNFVYKPIELLKQMRF